MANHLLLPLDNLYKLYNQPHIYFDSKEYVTMDCFYDFESIETDIVYDILNSMSLKEIQNLNRQLFCHWSSIVNDDNLRSLPDGRNILDRSFDHSNIQSLDELNDKLSNLIQKDPILSLYCINQIIIYVYPI